MEINSKSFDFIVGREVGVCDVFIMLLNDKETLDKVLDNFEDLELADLSAFSLDNLGKKGQKLARAINKFKLNRMGINYED